jgi:hypothetical protein
MQLPIENTDGEQVVEVQIRRAAALQVVRPIVLHGSGRSSLAAALEGVQRSGVPCIVEEPSGQAAELANELDLDDQVRAGIEREWTIAVWVGERNQHRWLRQPASDRPASETGSIAGPAPLILERGNGGHKLVYFGGS